MPRQPHPSELSDPSNQNKHVDDTQLQQEIDQAVNQLTGRQDQPAVLNKQTPASKDVSSPTPQSTNVNKSTQSYFNRPQNPVKNVNQPEHLSAQQLQNIREEVATPAIKNEKPSLENNQMLSSITPLKVILIAVALFVFGIGAGLIVVFLL